MKQTNIPKRKTQKGSNKWNQQRIPPQRIPQKEPVNGAQKGNPERSPQKVTQQGNPTRRSNIATPKFQKPDIRKLKTKPPKSPDFILETATNLLFGEGEKELPPTVTIELSPEELVECQDIKQRRLDWKDAQEQMSSVETSRTDACC
mgnify:CR=1 FL=1